MQGRTRLGLILAVWSSLTACAGGLLAPTDATEETFPVPVETVRAALVGVLVDDRYEVTLLEGGRFLRTTYREEIDSPWNWLLVARVGIVRSWVEATVSEEGASASRVRIEVFCEGKQGLFSSWRPYIPPLQQQGATHLRDLRHRLQLL